MSPDARTPFPTFASLAKQTWYLPVLRGIVAVVLGVVALVWPAVAVITLVTLLGILWIIDGALSVAGGIRRRSTPGSRWGWDVCFGAIGVVAGLILVLRPGLSAALLIVLAGIWAIVGGIVLSVGAFAARKAVGPGWGWGLALGLLTLAFGVVLVAAPDLTAVVLSVLLGIYAILAGLALIALGFAIRTLGKRAGGA